MRIATCETYGLLREDVEQVRRILLESGRYDVLILHNSLHPLTHELGGRKFSVVHFALPETAKRFRNHLRSDDIVPIQNPDAPLHLWGSDRDVAKKVLAFVGSSTNDEHFFGSYEDVVKTLFPPAA